MISKLATLGHRARALLIGLGAFATGVGVYAAWQVIDTENKWFVFLPWLFAGAIPVAVIGAWWLWWQLPKQQADRLQFAIRDPKARADVEDNFRKTIGQLLGGAAVLLGAGLAYLQFVGQQRASGDLLISNQVSKGFEQLGGDKVEIRMGGIYSLEGVMNTSAHYHRPILETLSAFIRDHTKIDTVETSEGPPSADVQSALTVIGRRIIIERRLDLQQVHIPQADLAGSNLSHAFFMRADLHGSNLIRADLSSTNLLGANLSGAELTGADLHHSVLLYTNLSNAILNGARLRDAFLVSATLSNAKLIEADLTGAMLVRANLGNALMGKAQLNRADLRGAQNLSQTQLDTACGTDAKLDRPLTIKPCP